MSFITVEASTIDLSQIVAMMQVSPKNSGGTPHEFILYFRGGAQHTIVHRYDIYKTIQGAWHQYLEKNGTEIKKVDIVPTKMGTTW